MVATLDEARAHLQAHGLYVASSGQDGLFVADNLVELEGGIKLSPNACTLLAQGSQGVAIFPGEGMTTRELRGTLQELVCFVEAVYSEHRTRGGLLRDAVAAVLANGKESFPNGQSLRDTISAPIAPPGEEPEVEQNR
jgi:hypothetical protein